jgi:type II secretory pathway pseudopilin PulG
MVRGRRSSGFTYLLLLWWVAIAGVLLMALGRHWSFERRREQEIEMVFRAQEIQRALTAYHRYVPEGGQAAWPKTLQDLVDDRRGPVVQHHLRRVWSDPLTGQSDWGLVREEPASAPAGEAAVPASDGSSAVASVAPFSPTPTASAPFVAAPFASAPPSDMVDTTPGITGVFSKAAGRPIRGPGGIRHYDEWRFDADSGASGP